MKEISPELALVDPELAAEARASLPEPAEPPPRRSRRLGIAVGMLLLVLGLAAVSAVVLLARGRDNEAQPQGAPASVAAVLGARKALPPLPGAVPPGRAARTYSWAATEGAVYYQVTFVRDGKPFHTAETPNAWLRVPNTLQFPPGTYRWSVRPAIADAAGIVLGDAVVVHTFRVTGG